MASQSTLASAEEEVVVVADNVATTFDSDAAAADVTAEIMVEEAIEAAVDDDAADAGKECDATGTDNNNDCAELAVVEEEEPVVVVSTSPPSVVEKEEDGEDDKNCPSRPQVIRCAAKHLDTNRNGALEREELENAMKNVSWIVRGLLKVIGSVDSIMKKCDADGDGAITMQHDMEATKETCLATCFKRKAFKRLFFPDCHE